MHEHFYFGYPANAGDTTSGSNSREIVINTSIDVVERAKAHGIETIVDATPKVVPALKNAGITDEQIDSIFIKNLKRIFGG